MEPREIVKAQVDAFNDRDLEGNLRHYAADVVVKDGAGVVLMAGIDAVRARYTEAMAENPDMHYDIPNRIVVGDWVVDEEALTGLKPGSPQLVRAILAYHVTDGLIREIFILSSVNVPSAG